MAVFVKGWFAVHLYWQIYIGKSAKAHQVTWEKHIKSLAKNTSGHNTKLHKQTS